MELVLQTAKSETLLLYKLFKARAKFENGDIDIVPLAL